MRNIETTCNIVRIFFKVVQLLLNLVRDQQLIIVLKQHIFSVSNRHGDEGITYLINFPVYLDVILDGDFSYFFIVTRFLVNLESMKIWSKELGEIILKVNLGDFSFALVIVL